VKLTVEKSLFLEGATDSGKTVMTFFNRELGIKRTNRLTITKSQNPPKTDPTRFDEKKSHYIYLMNFLGHLYFSRNDKELMLANLFGDFVKGKDLSHFSIKTQQGIYLHRNIDSYIDNHPAVHDLLQILYKPLPKVAGIAVDLYFDHILAENWKDFHEVKLADFIQDFYDSVHLNHEDFTPKFRLMMEKLIEHNWLYQYQFEHGLYKACQGVSRRLSFENPLSNGLDVYHEYKTEITKAFHLYMKDANSHLNNLILSPA
jgi:acyl carrier protein phosphodiesterase